MGLLERIQKRPEISSEIEGLDFSFEKPQKSTRRQRVSEMISSWDLGVRSGFRGFRKSFWPGQIAYERGTVSYAKTRSLYGNSDTSSSLAAFSRRIINSTVDFIDLPHAATGDPEVDDFLNRGIHEFWGREILEMVRDSCRDSKTIVRYRRDRPENPLVSDEEWPFGYLEIIPPETVQIYYRPDSKHEIERAYCTYTVEVIEDENDATTNGRGAFSEPSTVEHTIVEKITPEKYEYYDQTLGEWRDDLAQPNDWGFVPLHEAFNEWDSSIEDGQSDLENPTPFLLAFHDVLAQSLTAHKHHSIPKAKFKVNELMAFLANNFPEAFDLDENGEAIMGTFKGEISWQGSEIFFMEPEEDVEFLEAKSVLGDSKTLLDFLLECISISSETPKTILMNAKNTDNEESLPFSNKIKRKRTNFAYDIQMISKMAMKVNGFPPTKPKLDWDDVDPQEGVTKAQALQQDTMSLEVLRTAEVVSDDTVREHMRRHIPAMKPSPEEKAAAKNNVVVAITSPGATKGSDSGGPGE